MRKLLMWIVVTIGIAALVRKLRGRGAPEVSEFESPVEPAATTPADDPADDLRRKLSETRTAAPAADTALEPEATVDELRAEVHGEGRAAIDEMQRSTEG